MNSFWSGTFLYIELRRCHVVSVIESSLFVFGSIHTVKVKVKASRVQGVGSSTQAQDNALRTQFGAGHGEGWSSENYARTGALDLGGCFLCGK
eukprot:scaffold27078_cov77-Skeletonema_dohrnii-CCMP3373.AAC.7